MLSHIRLFVTPWTIAHQAPLSVELSRQEYWTRFPFPTPGDLPDSGIKPTTLASPALADESFTIVPPENSYVCICVYMYINTYIHIINQMYFSENKKKNEAKQSSHSFSVIS